MLALVVNAIFTDLNSGLELCESMLVDQNLPES